MNEELDLYFIKVNPFALYCTQNKIQINRVYMDMDSYFSSIFFFLVFLRVNKLKPQTVNMFISLNLNFQHLFR